MKRLIPIILLFINCHVYGQVSFKEAQVEQEPNLYFRHFTKENGLPSDVVKYVAQDAHGYIWIATDNGLVRYDGQRMQTFQHNPENPKSIAENMVYCIYQSKDSLIWLGTKNGFSVYNPLSGNFTNYNPYPSGQIAFPDVNVNHFYEDSDTSMWIASTDGLFHLNRNNNSYTRLLQNKEENTLQQSWRSFIYNILPHPTKKNLLFVSSQGGLFLVDRFKHELQADLTEEWPKGKRYMTQAMYLDGDSLLWNGEWGTGLRKLNLRNMKWTVYHFPANYFQGALHITKKSADELWVATPFHGLLIFNKKEERFLIHMKSDANPRSILSNVLHCNMLVDRKGDLWVGGKEGLNLLDKHYRSFKRVELPFDAGSAGCFFYDKDDDKLYVGVNHFYNLLVFDGESGTWHTVENGDPEVKPHANVSGIYKDSNGVIWVSTTRNNLLYIDSKSKTLKMFRDKGQKPVGINGKRIVLENIVEDQDNNLWINATLDGFVKIEAARDSFTVFSYQGEQTKAVSMSDRYFEVMVDNKNRLWSASRSGFIVYDIENDSYLDKFHQGLSALGIRKDQDVGGFATDSLGRVWVGLHGKGLLRISEEADGITYKLFHTAHGLNDPNISKIAVDSNGLFWIVNEGLLFFNPYTEQFNSFDKRNALHSNKSHYDIIYLDAHDNIYLRVTNGYETINAKDLTIRGGIINLLVEQIEINGTQHHLVDQGLQNPHIQLKASENNIRFSFSAICFQDTDRILYACRLLGYDDEPGSLSRQNTANYTNLPPGTYRFEVAAAHRGVWFDEKAFLDLTIKPYYHQMLWFRVLVILAIVLLLATIFKLRSNQIRKKEKIHTDFAKRIAEAEMKSLRAQMNPHFIFNSLNSINTFILKNETDVASEYLTKFSRLIRAVLNNSKNKLVTLEDELDALRIYLELEQIRFSNKFQFTIIIDQYLDANRVFVPPLLLQPYVENAIWHGLLYKPEQGTIEISAQKQDDYILFTVQDNGIGREKAAEYKSAFEFKGKSLGMSITAERLETINQLYSSKAKINIIDLYDTKQQAAGTRVTIMLPVITNK